MDITAYGVKKVLSTKTHEDTIDIELFDSGGKIRAFLSKDLAMELIHKMLTALSTSFQKEEDTTLM